MWHEDLIAKINRIDLAWGLIKITRFFLKDIKFQVALEGHISTNKKIQAGVAQGLVLGTILYNIFTHDIPESQHTFRALFADNTAIGGQFLNQNMARTKLQRNLNNVIDWMADSKIAVNPEKRQAICVNKNYIYAPGLYN